MVLPDDCENNWASLPWALFGYRTYSRRSTYRYQTYRTQDRLVYSKGLNLEFQLIDDPQLRDSIDQDLPNQDLQDHLLAIESFISFENNDQDCIRVKGPS